MRVWRGGVRREEEAVWDAGRTAEPQTACLPAHPCGGVQALTDAAEAGDSEAFTAAVAEFDSLTRLDAWKTTMLVGGGAGVGWVGGGRVCRSAAGERRWRCVWIERGGVGRGVRVREALWQVCCRG